MGSDYIIWEGIFIKVFEMGYGEEIFLKISSPQSFHNLCVLFFCPSSRKIRFAVASPCPPFLFRYASISEACTTGRLLSIESRLSIAGVRGQAWVPTQTQARLRLRGGIPARTPPAGKACGKGSKGYSDEGVAQTHQRGMIPLWKPAIG